MNTMTPERLVADAESAVAMEIEAVRERPSTDVLTGGKKVKSPAADEVHYRFETSNPSLRFAEKCRAILPGGECTITPVDTFDDGMVFRFPEDFGEAIPEMELEWENDFVLKKIEESLMELLGSTDRRDRIKRLLSPPDNGSVTELKIGKESGDESREENGEQSRNESREKNRRENGEENRNENWEVNGKESGEDNRRESGEPGPAIREDGNRNRAQREAIQKAMVQPVSYIWGPPGTGKTATLAYIMANYVLLGKSVLFVSNTNRAVDNGMLGLMDAMEMLELKSISRRITRFGERILESERLEKIHFDHQLDEMLRSQMQEAADLQHWLDARELPDLSADQKRHIAAKIERLGGVEAVEAQIQELTQKDRFTFTQLRRFKVVGTTLARVCTSEMLESMEFDAVVIDEASMANIPYMLVMASKAKEHLVVVGDPMQLPPIAITSDPEARKMLEQDIFATVSRAGSTEELFEWHDRNPGYTSFFNIQYRMQSDLADVISSVFYEGRLHSASETDPGRYPNSQPNQHSHPEPRPNAHTKVQQATGSVVLVDSSPLGPVLRQDSRRRGFQPVNDIHVTLLADLIRQVLTEMRIGLQDIGIIVPFRSSVWHLRKELRGKHRWYDLEIGTIHTFQGREKKVIILDTVMSGEAQNGSIRHYSVRPFDETKNGLSVPRLLNVAFSRSRERLFVIADMQHIRRVYGSKFLGKLLEKLPLKDF